MRLSYLIFAFALFLCAARVTAQVIYSTSFESPAFVNGNLASQDAWMSSNDPPTPGRGIVQNTLSHSGSQAVLIDASVSNSTDWFWKPLNYSVPVATAPIMQINWSLNLDGGSPPSTGWGIDMYDGSSPVQRRLYAVYVNSAGMLQVQDGFSFFNTGVVVSRNLWHNFRVDLDYASRQAKVFVDNTLVAQNHSLGPNINNVLSDVDLYNIDGNGGDKAYYDDFSVTNVPEPASASLVAIVILAIRRRRSRCLFPTNSRQRDAQ